VNFLHVHKANAVNRYYLNLYIPVWCICNCGVICISIMEILAKLPWYWYIFYLENLELFCNCYVVEQVAYLAMLGGSTIGNTTRRVLREIFSNRLALSLNFAGRGEKVGIGNMKIVSAVTCKLFSSLHCSFYVWVLYKRCSGAILGENMGQLLHDTYHCFCRL